MLRSTADLINRVGTSHAICIAERTAIAPKMTLANGQIITFEPSQQDDAPWLTNRMVLRSDYDRED